MSSTQVRVIVAGLFFVLIFLSGFVLSGSGKPYPMFLFTLHKLAALGAAVWMGIAVSKFNQVTPLTPLQWVSIWITGGLFGLMIITGGVMSAVKTTSGMIMSIHRYSPYLTLASSAWMLYGLLVRSALGIG